MTSDLISIIVEPRQHSDLRHLVTDIELVLFDQHNAISAKAANKLQANVAAGIYRLRARAYGLSNDKLIEVGEGQTAFSIDVPQRTSAIPDGVAHGSHEYYMASFFNNRKKLSTTGDNSVNEQALYIFVRMISAEHAKKEHDSQPVNLLENCWLESSEGDIVVSFTNDIVQCEASGVTWYRDHLPPNLYRLYRKDESGKIQWIPIHLYSSETCDMCFHTEIAFLWRKGIQLDSAVMATPSVTLSDWDYRIQLVQTDATLQSLAAGERSDQITTSLVKKMLSDKFVNPLQGIIACHLMLMRNEPNYGSLEQILSNIGALVDYSPDIEVLKYLVEKTKGDNRRKSSLPKLNGLPLIGNQFHRVATLILAEKAKSFVNTFISDSTLSSMTNFERQVSDYILFRDLSSPWLKTRPHSGTLFNNEGAARLAKKALSIGRSFFGLEYFPSDIKTAHEVEEEAEIINMPNWVIDIVKPSNWQLEMAKKSGEEYKPDFQSLASQYDLPEVLLNLAWDKFQMTSRIKTRYTDLSG